MKYVGCWINSALERKLTRINCYMLIPVSRVLYSITCPGFLNAVNWMRYNLTLYFSRFIVQAIIRTDIIIDLPKFTLVYHF